MGRMRLSQVSVMSLPRQSSVISQGYLKHIFKDKASYTAAIVPQHSVYSTEPNRTEPITPDESFV